ncbi:hypothetical protein J2853_008451 [Streptosporangium lutulentum]|uniref:Bacterial Ig-like domain-containing protein n=2 Tax=Streptosporangium lutulentum TaxID=1461250 RepID=A0ABT9QR60_9ACTN|nr:hypothetical protein [Streptosporangium lutulentum]
MTAMGAIVATPLTASASAPVPLDYQPVVATTTRLTSSCESGRPGPIALTARVTSAGGTTPAGLVSFSNGSTVLGSASLDMSGQAVLNPSLPAGRARITATFQGNPGQGLASSTSERLVQGVNSEGRCMTRRHSSHGGVGNTNNNNNADGFAGGGHHKRGRHG